MQINAIKHALQHSIFGENRQNLYFCIVFFIVLDLRLTRLGYRGIPFFMSLSLEKEISESSQQNHTKHRNQVLYQAF